MYNCRIVSVELQQIHNEFFKKLILHLLFSCIGWEYSKAACRATGE